MKLSVEISTYNRKGMLRTVLEKLAQQTYSFENFEVVISDDGSTDGTAEMVESMKKTLPYDIRYFQHHNRNIGITHNLGIKEARGDIVLMLANDILAEPQLLEEHMRVHEENPGPQVVVVGSLRQSPELTKTAFQRGWNVIINTLFSGNLTQMEYTDFKVSNMSFKKDFMVLHGMFREWPAGSHEDFELRYRLMQKGMKLITNNSALGYHFHEETLDTIAGRAYMHGVRWHYFEDSVPDLWIKAMSGHVKLSDGTGPFLKAILKKVIRKVFVNHFTITYFVIPFVKISERLPVPAFVMAFLVLKISSYNYHKGINDFRKKNKS